MSRRYTEEMKAFIAEHAVGNSTEELAQMFNEAFPDFGVTTKQMHAYKSNNKLKSGIKGRKPGFTVKYPPEMREYMKANAEGKSTPELIEMIKRQYGIEMTPKQMKAYKGNNNINTGLTGRFEKGNIPPNKGKHMPIYPGMEKTLFKKGHIPHNAAKVGELRVNTDGYLVRKVAQPNKWRFESHLVWEEHNGPIPDGCRITHLDGDKMNVDINNLECITNAEHLEMIRKGLRFNDSELTRAGVAVAKLTVATRKAKKNNAR